MREEHLLEKAFSEDFSSIQEASSLIRQISQRHGIEERFVFNLIEEPSYSIPLSFFASPLPPLEALVYFLNRKFGLSIAAIAKLLERDHTTVWTTLSKAKKRTPELSVEGWPEECIISLSIFMGRDTSILESLCLHLREKGMSYHEIAVLLKRNDRTIWTVVNRGERKQRKYS